MSPSTHGVVCNLKAVLNEKDCEARRSRGNGADLDSSRFGDGNGMNVQTGWVREQGGALKDDVTIVPARTASTGGVLSIGSYARTLANMTTNTNRSDRECRASYADVASDVFPSSSAADSSENFPKERSVQAWNNASDDLSSVGTCTPSLANFPNRKKSSVASAYSSKDVFDRSLSMEGEAIYGDGSCCEVSSVGSDAPTMTTGKSAMPRANNANRKEASVASTYNSNEAFDRSLSVEGEAIYGDGSCCEVSSVGSDAPTMTTHKSAKTLGNSSIKVQKGLDNEIDDGVSSVGMSNAPTLMGYRSIDGSAPSVTFEGLVRVIEHRGTDDVSAIGSRAPTLALLRGSSGGSRTPLSSMRAKVPSAIPTRVSSKQKPKIYEAGDNDSGMTFDHYASDIALLGGVLGREELKSGLEGVVGTFLRRGACVGISIWICLLIAIAFVAPISSYEYMTGQEQMASATLLTLLIGVNFNRLGPLLVTDRSYNFLNSGAMMASCVVQFIAIVSCAIMLFLPTPVMIDPIIGVRCHLVRWAEWTALAFVMTFLTESVDLSLEDADAKHAWAVATCIALSTVCGGIFPFCPSIASWWVVFATSWLLFSVLYVRLLWRGTRLLRMPVAVTTADKEDQERARYSFKIMIICTCIWTSLAGAWSVCALSYNYAEPGSFWANDWLLLVVENFFEALSKIGYLSILLEVHEVLFDDVSKTARRLGDLRSYMSAVWDVSTDVVIICSSHDHLVSAAVSPSIYQMETALGSQKTNVQRLGPQDHDLTTLVMEVDPYEGSYQTFEMDLSKPMSREEANMMLKRSRDKARMITPTFEKNLKVLSDLVCDACSISFPSGHTQNVVYRDFYCVDNEREEHNLCCEAKIVKLKDKAFLIVLRDVTQHYNTGRGGTDASTSTSS
jgi:hypothetical protein